MHAAEIGGRADAIIVCGDSAGANLATALALHFLGNAACPRGQILFYPCLDVDFQSPSYIEEADAPFLKAAEMIWFWDQYCPTAEHRLNALAVPMLARDMAGMPPALIITAQHDPLRDDGARYAKLLQQAGVAAVLRPGAGLIHGFLRTVGQCGAAQAEVDAAAQFLRRIVSS